MVVVVVDDLAVVSVGVTAGVLAVSCAAGWTGNHASDIARSWQDGRAQVAAWAGSAVSYALLAASAVELWVLLHTAARKGGA